MALDREHNASFVIVPRPVLESHREQGGHGLRKLARGLLFEWGRRIRHGSRERNAA